MSDLVKYEGRVSESNHSDIFETVRGLYRIAYGITGYKIDAEKVKTIDIPLTVQYIQENHPRRTAKDLELAFKWGALGKFGEYTGINTKTIANWINGYLNTYEFKQTLKPEPKKELPPPNMDYNEVWQQALEEFKTGHEPRGLASFILNAGRALHKFDWEDSEFIEECKYRARVRMLARIKAAGDLDTLRVLKSRLKDEKGDAFRAECKRQAVLIKLEEEST